MERIETLTPSGRIRRIKIGRKKHKIPAVFDESYTVYDSLQELKDAVCQAVIERIADDSGLDDTGIKERWDALQDLVASIDFNTWQNKKGTWTFCDYAIENLAMDIQEQAEQDRGAQP